MQNLVIKLLAVFVVSAILRLLIHMIFGPGLASTAGSILIDIGVLGYIYALLKEYRYINLRKTMFFLGGITFISILADIGILRGDFAQLIILAILAWMIFGTGGFFGGGRRFR